MGEKYHKPSHDSDPVNHSADEAQFILPLSRSNERKLLAQIDLRLMPCLCILYLLAFLDRVNIANAVLFKLKEDLQLSGVEYNTALTIFFVPYIIFEIPSNILLKRLRPHVWLSGCMFMFGLATTLQGIVQSYSGLLTTRFFLGLFETGMFPGCFYLIGMWYRRAEAQKRFSFFFSSTTLAGAFGGLLASAIGKMDGLRGYHGWRWIFILEGCLTCVVACLFFFVLPGFPEDAKWLRPHEREFVRDRLSKEQGPNAAEKKISFRDVLDVFKDYKVFLGGLMYMGLIVPAYGYAFFAPTIISTYGYSPIATQLHSVPPWAAAFGFSMLVAIGSDRLRHRFLFALLPILLALGAFATLLTVHGTPHRHVQYAMLFLVTSGAYAAMPVVLCWFNLNLGGHRRRAVGSAWQIAFGNIGGIVATYAFLERDAPDYRRGYCICVGFLALGAAACAVYCAACGWQNRKRKQTPRDREIEAEEEAEMGDLAPGYRYLL